MARYKVQAPDGQIITIEGPEGASQEEVIAKAQQLYKARPTSQAVTATTEGMYDPSAEAMISGIPYTGESTAVDRRVGAVLKGAIQDPITAVRQIVGGEETRQTIKAQEAAYQALRKQYGDEGFETSRFVGSLLSPINIAVPGAAAVTAARAGAGTLRQAGIAGVTGAALQPVTTTEDVSNFWKDKIEQLGVGATFGIAAQAGINVGSKAFSFLRSLTAPLTEAGRDRILKKAFDELSGGDLDKVINATRNAQQLVAGSRPTVAEAVTEVPTALNIASYQRALERTQETAPLFEQRLREQALARQVALGQEVGPEIPGQSAITRLEAARQAETAPLREEALAQANIAGQTLPRLEAEAAARQAEAEALSGLQRQFTQRAGEQEMFARQAFTPIPGLPRVSSTYRPSYDNNLTRATEAIQAAKETKNLAAQRVAEANFKKFQADSLADEGFFPLTAEPVVSRINTILNTPGERSEVAIDTLTALRDKLVARSDERGIIDSRDLYTIRKEIADDIKAFGEARKTSDSRRLASLETNLKTLIDNSIEKSGGVRWKEYLTNFATYSKKIDQANVGRELSNRLGNYVDDVERAGAFYNAVENSVSTLRRASGAQRYTQLSEVLDEKQLQAVNSVQADIQRRAKAVALGRKTSVGERSVADTPELPQLLDRAAAITNALLTQLKRNAIPEMNRRAAELLLDPVAFSAFISSIPKDKANTIANAILPRLDPTTREAFVRAMGIQAGIVAPININQRSDVEE